MSYQQFPGQPGAPQQPPYGGQPAGPAPVVQQPGAPFAPAAAPGGRRKGLLIAGVVVLLAGVGGGLGLLAAAGSAYEDGVKNLARAPIGCTTTLEFDEAGTYTFFVETKGTIGDVRGDCENTDTDYDRGDDDLPDVDLALVNEDGDEVDFDDDDSKDYDVSGYAGQSIATADIEDAGSYELSVSSDEDEFVISVGKDPKNDVGVAGVAGLALLIVGGLAGLVMIILGLRRKPAAPGSDPSAGGYPPQGYQPQAAAGFPGQPAPPQQYPAPPQTGYAQPAPPTQQLPPTQPGPYAPPPAPGGWQQPGQ